MITDLIKMETEVIDIDSNKLYKSEMDLLVNFDDENRTTSYKVVSDKVLYDNYTFKNVELEKSEIEEILDSIAKYNESHMLIQEHVSYSGIYFNGDGELYKRKISFTRMDSKKLMYMKTE